MAIHELEPTRETLHGCFSLELPPVLSIASGDSIRARTLDAGWGLEAHEPPFSPRRKFEPRLRGRDSGHALLGPIEVRGAEPGMVLEVRVDALIPGPWGWTFAGGVDRPIDRWLEVHEADEYGLAWTIDGAAMLARNQFGETVSLRPFLGVMGMPPAEPGLHATFPPRRTGGNLDCKELVEGSTLFLPIAFPARCSPSGTATHCKGTARCAVRRSSARWSAWSSRSCCATTSNSMRRARRHPPAGSRSD